MTIYNRTRVSARLTPQRMPSVLARPSCSPESELASMIGQWAELVAARFPETAMLLEIARLDLVARLNGISDEEMQQIAAGGRSAPAEPESASLRTDRVDPVVAAPRACLPPAY